MTYTFNNENLFFNAASYELQNTKSVSSDFSELTFWQKAEQTCNLEQDQLAAICTKAVKHHKCSFTSFFVKLKRRLEDLRWNLSFQKTFVPLENKKA